VINALRSLSFRTWRRTRNRWRDLRAVAAGYCNDCPWRAAPDAGGGYTWWRCGLRRRHGGLHRHNNYVWTDDGRTDYLPIPVGQPSPRQPRDRDGTPSLRQARERRRWLEARYAVQLRRSGR
jgi:hypothetical protein